jgi:hypothetical protein
MKTGKDYPILFSRADAQRVDLVGILSVRLSLVENTATK